MKNYQRREFLSLSTALATSTLLPDFSLQAQETAVPQKKKIPTRGELLSSVGMGTWITFNVGRNQRLRDARTEVLAEFLTHGGGMIDSSPMYGSAEEVLGYALAKLGSKKGIFSATKIWTQSGEEGQEQFTSSKRLWGLDTFALEQIHNLVSWKSHLPYLRELKQSGAIRYLGITTSHGRRHQELEKIMAREPLDFVQLTYNIQTREVEQRLLPLAKEKGIAVIANRPFEGGSLIDFVKRHPLPPWAAEFECTNWAGFLLKFITSHPAITCAIPATSSVLHMRENMSGAAGALPDEKMRKKMIAYITSL